MKAADLTSEKIQKKYDAHRSQHPVRPEWPVYEAEYRDHQKDPKQNKMKYQKWIPFKIKYQFFIFFHLLIL